MCVLPVSIVKTDIGLGLNIYRDGIGGCPKKETTLTEEVTTLRRHMAAIHEV